MAERWSHHGFHPTIGYSTIGNFDERRVATLVAHAENTMKFLNLGNTGLRCAHRSQNIGAFEAQRSFYSTKIGSARELHQSIILGDSAHIIGLPGADL
jgi:hypothetical protein